jgi:hypothetical protein
MQKLSSPIPAISQTRILFRDYSLKEENPQAVELVHLRYFVGVSIPDAANMLGIAPRTADRLWAFARAWLHREIADGEGS